MKYPFGVLRVFFSLRCNFNCGYCSMKNQPELWKGDDFKEVTPDKWIDAFKRLEPQRDLIVTPCNAEPPIYSGCAEITNKGLNNFQTHMYTNLSSLSMEEIRKMKPRNNLAFYVSYHRGQIDVKEFIENAKELQSGWNVINFHAPMYPPFQKQILEDAKLMKENGILLDTTHEYLGMYKDKMHYSYLLDGADEPGDWIKNRLANKLEGTPKKKVLCKTSFDHDSFYSRTYTVAPDGDFYTCWRHLYNKDPKGVIGNFFDKKFEFEDKYYECNDYGDCNICAWHKDIKDAETGVQLDEDVSKMGNSISACMIVRDEEDTIQDCLGSIHDWVDEIILVDTGSKDKTIEIAKTFDKVRIFHQPWQNDFSFHRNYSIKQATKDWVFIIDADERVIPGHGENLKKVIAGFKQKFVAIIVDIYNMYGQPRIAKAQLKSLRFFLRSNNPRYDGKIHNRPVISGNTKAFTIPFRINHFGYDMPQEVMDRKYKRTKDLCEEWTIKEPECAEAWLHLARVMKTKDGKVNMGEIDKIFKVLHSGIALHNGNGDFCNIHAQLLNLMAWMKHLNAEDDEAIGFGRRALAMKSDYLDSILLVGLAYTYGVDMKQGEEWLLRYLREQEAYKFTNKLDGIDMMHMNDRKLAYQTLVAIETEKEKKGL